MKFLQCYQKESTKIETKDSQNIWAQLKIKLKIVMEF